MKEENERIGKMEAYLKEMAENEKSPVTINKYRRDILRFLTFWGKEELTRELCLNYKASLVEEKFQASSINSMMASLNGFLVYLGREDCTVRHLRTQSKVYCSAERELTREEFEKLIAATKKDERLKLLLQTVGGTGIRISELKYFTVEAAERGEIEVSCKNKIRTILIPEILQKKLLDYAKQRGIRTGPVFRTAGGKCLDRSEIWKQMKRICRIAGVQSEKVYPHNLRKLFARTFYRKEQDLAMLADLLGHSSLDTTRLYIKSTGQEHKKKMEGLKLIT